MTTSGAIRANQQGDTTTVVADDDDVDERAKERKAQLLKERGNSFYVRHQFVQAIEWYTQSIETNPKAYDVYTNRSSAYAKLKMWEESLRDAQESIRIKPNWLKGHWRVGTCLMELKQYQQAAKTLEEGLKINPASEQILQELKKVKEYLKLMPASAEEAKRKGNDCFREGRFEEAIRLYKESLRLIEDDTALKATVLINSAEAYRQLGEYEKVIDQCNLAIDLQKGSAKAHLRRGLACEKLEKYDLAQSDFKTVIELDPTNHIASSGLVRCAKVRQLASKSAF